MNGPISERFEAFVACTRQLRGDEKGEGRKSSLLYFSPPFRRSSRS
jgi:hypothetical protein